MNTISKVMNPEETSKERLFSERVLRHKGSVVLLRNVRNKLSASSRPSIDEAVQTIEALKDKGLGDVVSTNKTKAFVKQIPDKVDDALLEEYGMDVREYTQLFLAKDMELNPQHKSYVLNLSEIGHNVSDFEQNQKENVDSSN